MRSCQSPPGESTRREEANHSHSHLVEFRGWVSFASHSCAVASERRGESLRSTTALDGRQLPMRALVVCLRRSICPAHIARLIVAVVVDPIERVAEWAMPQVL